MIDHIDPMIRQIVNRCHISESNRQVIYYLISRLKDGKKTYWTIPKVERKQILKAIIQYHRENKQMYYDVMRGY